MKDSGRLERCTNTLKRGRRKRGTRETRHNYCRPRNGWAREPRILLPQCLHRAPKTLQDDRGYESTAAGLAPPAGSYQVWVNDPDGSFVWKVGGALCSEIVRICVAW